MGKMGQIRAHYVEQHEDMELVAICDKSRERSLPYSNVTWYDDYRKLINSDVDAVYACAFNNVLPDICVRALNAGRHVFSEKPPGRNVEDVLRIREAEAANPGVKLMFGFNHRCHYSVMEAKSMIESGDFGRILWLRGTYGKCGSLHYEDAWRNRADVSGGGILIDQGIHMLDLFRFFCGDFPEIKSMVETSFWKIPVEDNAFAILRNEAGQVAMIHSSATQWKHRFTLDICLEGGYININGLITSTRSYGDESITFARKEFEDRTSAFGRPREQTIFFDRDDSWKIEAENFARVILEDAPVDVNNSDDALAAMDLVARIYAEDAG
jgi:predicted dehydrogenase